MAIQMVQSTVAALAPTAVVPLDVPIVRKPKMLKGYERVTL